MLFFWTWVLYSFLLTILIRILTLPWDSKIRQIDQRGFLLETYSPKGSVLKLFTEGVPFWKHFVSLVGETGHVAADGGFHQSCWRNRTRGVDATSPVGETGDTWRGYRHSLRRSTFGCTEIISFKRL